MVQDRTHLDSTGGSAQCGESPSSHPYEVHTVRWPHKYSGSKLGKTGSYSQAKGKSIAGRSESASKSDAVELFVSKVQQAYS